MERFNIRTLEAKTDKLWSMIGHDNGITPLSCLVRMKFHNLYDLRGRYSKVRLRDCIMKIDNCCEGATQIYGRQGQTLDAGKLGKGTHVGICFR